MRLLSRRAVATALAAAVSIAQPTKLPCSAAAAPSYPLGLTSAGSLRNCPPLSATESGCITSMPASSPNRYLPPMRYDGEKLGREGAYRRVRSYFGADADATLDPEAATDGSYLHYVLNEGSSDVADLELRFLPDDPLIAFRLLARKPRPTQPLCLQRGCINGNNRERAVIDKLRVDNGFSDDGDKYQVEKDWVPIFFH